MKYCEERVDGIMKAIEAGLPITRACKLNDISGETFHRWKKDKPDFHDKIKKAGVIGETELLTRIKKAGTKDWKANAWILERTRQKCYALRAKYDVEHSGVVNVISSVPKPKEEGSLNENTGSIRADGKAKKVSSKPG